MDGSRRTTSIHILDDDSLLHVFYLYRPFLLGEDQDDRARLYGGGTEDGSVDGGGIGLPMFANDGETLFLAQHPTLVFP